ncbi:hypothetical protein BDA96_04G017300 [Sorghum bicolor]|uniref:Knottin scorpion toxin-like domain-containing protein n=2 Tax=Sorghum bicolor TaxID=4558 RepID=A0A921R1L4_SORBI|nr:hypothetical protein BDA96_04G017300 [Sorghum bicolor]KXG29310.1 hypothetical protein SORBI_3004G015200 [Sorghum bicolor]
MTRTNITMMKMQKILIFPLIVLLMLSNVLVASRYVSEEPRNKESDETTGLCKDIQKCSYKCFHSGACNRCCMSQGWAHGKCEALMCNCCNDAPQPLPLLE